MIQNKPTLPHLEVRMCSDMRVPIRWPASTSLFAYFAVVDVEANPPMSSWMGAGFADCSPWHEKKFRLI